MGMCMGVSVHGYAYPRGALTATVQERGGGVEGGVTVLKLRATDDHPWLVPHFGACVVDFYLAAVCDLID